MQDAAMTAREENLGIWECIHDVLIPMELRFLNKKRDPLKVLCRFEE